MNAVDVAVSPDGAAVYVISRFGDSGIYHFARNTTSGALSYRNCVGDDDVPACDKSMAGIDDPTGVAISPAATTSTSRTSAPTRSRTSGSTPPTAT